MASHPNAPRRLAEAIFRLGLIMSPRRKWQFALLLVLMAASSLAEALSLGTIVPFLAALTAPTQVQYNPAFQFLFSALPGLTKANLVFWLALIFCVVTLIAAGIRILTLYVNTGFSFALGADIGREIYRTTLYQPYPAHLTRNTADVINSVVGKTNVMVNSVIGQLLSIVNSMFFVIAMLVALLAISPGITVGAVVTFVLIYGVILLWTRRRLSRDSTIVAHESTEVYRALQEGLGGIRDVLIDNSQDIFTEIFQTADRRMRAAQGRMLLTAGSPRFIVEALGMISIALLAAATSGANSDVSIVPVLGALALGAQRLLPVVQQAYYAIVTIRGSEASLWDVLDLLERPLPPEARQSIAPMSFNRALLLQNISFRYAPEAEAVLANVSLKIEKGARVGIYGPTGGGKSTLLDILMGLLEPTEGAMFVDDVAVDASNRAGWRAHVAHVPQSIFLTDGSVSENIAFGQPAGKIDISRVAAAAAHAQIADTIDAMSGGYNAPVGERGARISGGQRQRLGIARALYKNAAVIIFDEASSALDADTERELMRSIATLSEDLTIIMVAHRLSTLESCDIFLRVEGGRVVAQDRQEFNAELARSAIERTSHRDA